MLPWLGARPQAVSKYCNIYLHNGFDVLVVQSEMMEFLFPQWGLDRGRSLLQLLESDPFVSRRLLVHAFSIGGYSFAQMLVAASKEGEKYESLIKRIDGQIYDSLVVGSLEHMATGVGKMILPCCETLVKRAALLYFDKFKEQTTDHFNTAIDMFWNTPVTAPALLFYCDNDPLCDAQTVARMAADWRGRSMKVTEKRWEESIHAGHLKRHQEEYLSVLHMFLDSVDKPPRKAKL
ncbi:uncharacterized protein KZ484_002387 [Pholidichthys leucotaenia]